MYGGTESVNGNVFHFGCAMFYYLVERCSSLELQFKYKSIRLLCNTSTLLELLSSSVSLPFNCSSNCIALKNKFRYILLSDIKYLFRNAANNSLDSIDHENHFHFHKGRSKASPYFGVSQGTLLNYASNIQCTFSSSCQRYTVISGYGALNLLHSSNSHVND
ncbi:hypothetical protein V1477_005741 [Vespula maculifrons]|uniref:Uncharacterized protein n=1 Tax=Vespula maculifrons TaxID=7453 RepID=A0ABD2CN13_VESMC